MSTYPAHTASPASRQPEPISPVHAGIAAVARRVLAAVAAMGGIAAGAVLLPFGVPSASAASGDLGSCLSAGQYIEPGQYLAAPALTPGGPSPYELIMQTDGNLVVYNAAYRPLWDSQTNGRPGAYAVLQSSDGNLVVYSTSGQALWSAYVPTSPGDRLCMQSDGNAVVYSPANSPLWATMTPITAVPGQTLTANPGAPGQCTWWAEHQFLDWTGTYINTLGINGTNGNALYWAYNAAHRGWATGSTPRIGSIAVFQPGVAGAGSVGHVAWVTEVYPSQNAIEISEMNFKGPGIVDNRRISPAFGVAGLQYIYANP